MPCLRPHLQDGPRRAPPMASPTAVMTGDLLVVFLFGAQVALAAPAHLASPLALLAGSALAVDRSASVPSSPLRRFRTRSIISSPVCYNTLKEMVNFSKKLTTDQVPGWEEYYFNYKMLKARVKVYMEQTKEGNHDRRHVLKDFSKLLDDEIVLFMIEQQGLIAASLEQLGKRRAVLEDILLLQEITVPRDSHMSIKDSSNASSDLGEARST